jgi:hypothetical protein
MAPLLVYNELTYSDTIGVLSLSSFKRRASGQAFNYNETQYIVALNRALQLEHLAVAIYAAKQRCPSDGRAGATALDRTDSHHKALRQLVQLIFAQKGLPDSGPADLTALTGTVAVRMSRYMPSLVQDPVLGVSAQRIEYALARRYRQLLQIAPKTDQEIVNRLLLQTVSFTGQIS